MVVGEARAVFHANSWLGVRTLKWSTRLNSGKVMDVEERNKNLKAYILSLSVFTCWMTSVKFFHIRNLKALLYAALPFGNYNSDLSI